MITVYAFTSFDIAEGENVGAQCKMPADEIAKLGGVIVEGTGEDVPESTLDDNRRYYPDA